MAPSLLPAVAARSISADPAVGDLRSAVTVSRRSALSVSIGRGRGAATKICVAGATRSQHPGRSAQRRRLRGFGLASLVDPPCPRELVREPDDSPDVLAEARVGVHEVIDLLHIGQLWVNTVLVSAVRAAQEHAVGTQIDLQHH